MSSVEEISFKEFLKKIIRIFKYLISNWKVIALASLVCGLLGIAVAYIKRPVYEAKLSFALEDEKTSGLGGYAALAGQFGIDLGSAGGGAFSGDNLLELMKSRSMIQKTLLTTVEVNKRSTTLAEIYIDFNRLRKGWTNKPKLIKIHFLPHDNAENFTLQKDSLLGEFHESIIKKNLQVEKIDKKLSIILVTLESKNEMFSKLFVENLVRNVSTFYIESKTKKSIQNVTILQHQTDSVRRELNRAISGVASSIDVNPNLNPSRQVLRVPSQRRQVDVQANTAILQELIKNLEISKVTQRKETPLIQIIDEPILPLKESKIGKILGLIVGGFIGVALSSIYFSFKFLFKDL